MGGGGGGGVKLWQVDKYVSGVRGRGGLIVVCVCWGG